MLECFYPERMEQSVYVIPFDHYRAKGMKGVIFDIDNTLVPHGAPADQRALGLFERLRSLGFETCLLSNNKEPRVRSFGDQVGSSYIYKGGKPGTGGYERAMEVMGTSRENTLFVGDQLFTDIWGANRAGLHSILVSPIDPREEIQIVLKRFLEKPVLYFCRRHNRRRSAGK